MSIFWFRAAAILCFLGVALGAFGAHSLKETLQAHNMVSVWEKAVLYHFLHALALLVLALRGIGGGPSILFLAGIILFSGSLYLLALTNVHWLGAVTPLGGLCFLAGWAWLAVVGSR